MSKKVMAIAVTVVIASAHAYTGYMLNQQFRYLKAVL
jgi:hypothetical protein